MKTLSTISLLWLLLAGMAQAGDVGATVSTLQHEWAVANYQLSGDAQQQAFETLIARADTAVASNPGDAGLLIWNGIIKSSFAGIKGGLGALSLAKQARKSLQAALAADEFALDGSAYTSLGTLYFKVPGFPVGFGNDKKAVELLQRALEINPDGIDPNYFYADYLMHKKQFEMAEQHLLKAQQAAPRADRPLADSGRREEIGAALALIRQKQQLQAGSR